MINELIDLMTGKLVIFEVFTIDGDTIQDGVPEVAIPIGSGPAMQSSLAGHMT